MLSRVCVHMCEHAHAFMYEHVMSMFEGMCVWSCEHFCICELIGIYVSKCLRM